MLVKFSALISIVILTATGGHLSVRAATPERLTLDLDRAISIANDSSLSAFRYKNLYLASYWEFRSFKANRLPSLTLNLTPASYNRFITQRYDSNENIDVYRPQQTYSAAGSLAIQQNFDLLGGTFYLESNLQYLRNFGAYAGNQYSTVPLRIGYQQNLLGYNGFRWERKIEPLKYEKAKLELLYNMESVAENAVNYFFALALAQVEFQLAQENVASADTLYQTGQRRFKIAAISQTDLLTLELDKVNAYNTLENCRIALKRRMFSLASFLGLDTNTLIDVQIPGTPAAFEIPAEEALLQAKANSPELMAHRQTLLEAEREINRNHVQSLFDASLNASIGFNQVAGHLSDAYRNVMRQDLVSITLSIPLVDWGVRKGRLNMARNNMNVAEIAARQAELSVEEDVLMTINDFNVHQKMIQSARLALDLADAAYDQTRKKFIIGNADINSLTLSHSRQQDAHKNYINALGNYWESLYKIRRLTLYDFELGKPLSDLFDFNQYR